MKFNVLLKNFGLEDSTFWSDIEFLQSKELSEFYTSWKNEKADTLRKQREEKEKEQRRVLFEQLKKEFEK